MSAIAALFHVEDDDEQGLTGALMVWSTLDLVRRYMTQKK